MNHVGDNQSKQHPIDTLISYSEKLKIEGLVSILKYNKENEVNTHIHSKCRKSLKKQLPARNEHLKVNIQQQLKELVEGPKLRNLILKNRISIVAKYVSSTANIPILIRLEWLQQKILAFTVTILH